jgi:hypothetical protein
MELNEIYNNLFDVKFSSFKGLKDPEYNLLTDTFQEMNKEYIIFELLEVSKKIQPLEIIIKLISNKLVGDLIIDIHNKEGEVLGRIKFKNFIFKKIEDLIDFNFSTENNQKNIKVIYEYDEVLYIGKDGKDEKIS